MSELEALKSKSILKASIQAVPEFEEKICRMHLNENLLIDRSLLLEIAQEILPKLDFRKYPQPYYKSLVGDLAEFLNVDPKNVFVERGCETLLKYMALLFNKARFLIGEPTFPILAYYCKAFGVNFNRVLLKEDFSLDVNRILAYNQQCNILFMASPNNPTANQFSKEDISTVLENWKGLVIVDEVYVNFGTYTVLNLVEDFDNVIILRSFSKDAGLSGLRFGYIIASEKIINRIKVLSGPFPIDVFSCEMVRAVLDRWSYFRSMIHSVITEREHFRVILKEIPEIVVYPSDTNFILVRFPRSVKAEYIVKLLLKRGFAVKDVGEYPLLTNCIRVTVSTRETNEAFTSVLKEIIPKFMWE
ncbi:hypothetical protein DRN89_02000 [archaeon]|nr:MAG: hypothetical protein DRN89_02000 [archaeon]